MNAKQLRRYGLRKTGSYTRCGSKHEKKIASKAVRRCNKDQAEKEGKQHECD